MELLSKTLKKKILSQLAPSKTEQLKIDSTVEEFILKIKEIINSKQLNISILIGGSYAKNTYLKTNFDVDIFFQFTNEDFIDDEKSALVIDVMKELDINFQIEQGSRVYVSGKYFSSKNDISISFECVPTQKVMNVDEALNSTDLSIYHVEFIKKFISKDLNLSNEIRLAKQWFKSKKLYGAESYINGFSGHGIECLMMHCKTFENLLFFLSNMKVGEVIDLGVKWDVAKISKDKLSSLIIKDPIVEGRNALSALSKDKFYRAKFESQLMILNGIRESDFELITFNSINDLEENFIENKSNGILVKFRFDSNLVQSSDIIGSKSKKLLEKLSKKIQQLGFEVLQLNFIYSHNLRIFLGYIELNSFEISSSYYVKGPKMDLSKEIISSFISANNLDDISLKGDCLYVKKLRKETHIKLVLKLFDSTNKLEKLFLNKSFQDLVDVQFILIN